MKKGKNIFFIIAAVIAVLLIGRNFIIKGAIEAGVHAATGLSLKIGKLNVGLFKSAIDIGNLRVYNPRGYEEKIMVDIPEVYVDYAPLSILKGKIHLEEIRFNLEQFNIVRNKNGDLNLNAIKGMGKKEGNQKEESSGKKAKSQEIQIDNMRLKIGKASFIDYSKGDEPSVKEKDINLDEEYKNIKNLPTVISIIVFKVVTKLAVGDIIDFDIMGLKGAVTDSLKSAGETAGKVATEALDKTTETTKDAVESLKKTKEGISGLLKKALD